MITDNEIRQQGYAYFLAEAPELLQTIEQDLFSLSEDHSTAKIHNLMRATHTIKGGAATVGLDTIKMIAHSLEDIFKALYSPDLVIDGELYTLLLEGYECLQLAVTAELTSSNIDSEEILQRATTAFAQLQTKLGDHFGAESHIPTSEELGFDIVQSIFEVGVTQRLESIAEAIHNSLNNQELVEFLNLQVEVFLGLAESLNLPGFGELSRTITAALAANPQQVRQIAEIALTDLQAAQKAVLAGDRTCGGSPSLALQAMTGVVTDYIATQPTTSSLATLPKQETAIIHINNSFAEKFFSLTTEFYHFLTTSGDINNEPLKPANAKFYLKVIRYIFGWFNHKRDIPEAALSLELLISSDDEEKAVEYIETWLNEFLDFIEEEQDHQNLCLYRRGVILIILLSLAKFQYLVFNRNSAISIISTLRKQIRELGKEYKHYPAVTEAEKKWLDNPKLQELLVIKSIPTPVASTTDYNLLEEIWGGETIPETGEHHFPTHTAENVKNDDYLGSVTSSVISDQVVTNPPESNLEFITEDQEINQTEIEDKSQSSPNKNTRQPSFVRVDVEGLQRLNYLAGELLIYQKRRSLYDEQVLELIERLSQQLSKHQSILNQLRDLPLQGNNVAIEPRQNVSNVQFDTLEMDVYTEFNLTLHEALEETLQIQETADSLDLLMRQSTQISEQQSNLTLNIIDNLVEARMLPLGTILNRFPQMVNKLGNVYAKLVELKLTGTQVLIDKAIAEKLYDPLVQLVRNAFDHGIESPEMRRQLGKNEQGLIEICAYHQGSQTIIEVRDDGQGLNLGKIRNRAIELNVIPDDHHGQDYERNLTESELINLMFTPGFSTAGKVSEISGRGMGLDIVRTQLQALNGVISVQSSPHQGTTFILKIPFSMTTDKLMLVQAGGVVYALLLDSIEKILIPSEQQIKDFEGKQILYWNSGEEEMMVNLIKLSNLMYYNGSLVGSNYLNNIPHNPDTEIMKNPVLLLRRNQGILGLEIDHIIGEQELVIRPLGSAITPPKYIYGCSSLANGNLILVIDGTLLIDAQQMQATLDVRTLPTTAKSQKQALPMSENRIESTPLLAASNTVKIQESPATSIESTPLLAASTPANTRESQPSSYVGITPKLPPIVLVIDDAISVRQTLVMTLQKSGYQVFSAQNGVEALEQLQLHPEVEVIISDLEMPRMNGFELLSHIRQNPTLAQKPVVVLTSRSSEKHRQLAQELGATAYLTKPYLEHEFLSTVDSLVNRDRVEN
ncbi:hybrid sensor histidine kinase/response regulator [Sphaerospermopsis aphanizomenoides BCCUSP55]|uniref:hybrid sensor histidine kinase/response regulator n=1 Tax=Sphaerospermopsis aphanizomenoides TaxID=459663 RepID=UPI0019078A4C|nr:hybrid sensor histidine kinase/response regulator [Sphaerospermopsis aphanizomenoides]MBK1986804.1 hybrid sensor histidine kinase/response regulator [Sphaerospermopsis aphanizomenoides BCCUSP55]